MGSPAVTTSINPAQFLSKITVDQGPEFEQTLPFTALTQVSTPTSLRTDRKIKFILLHLKVRMTNVGALTLRTAPSLLGTQLFALIQQVTIRGVHLRYGNQSPIVMRGETIAEMAAMILGPNYIPWFTVAQNGGAPIRGQALAVGAGGFNDIELILPIPLFPMGMAGGDATLHCLHGPDWPGNLYVDVLYGDGSAVATVNGAAVTFSAFGSATGTGTCTILTERPAPGKDLASKISPAVLFRITNFSQPTAAVNSITGTGVKLADLTVGKDTCRLWLKAGVLATGLSAGVITYGSLSDLIVTRTFFSLDNRQLRFQEQNDNAALQDYMGRTYFRVIPAGYTDIDFIMYPARGAANASAVFGSSQLTAARQFQLNGDVTSSATNIAEVVQEMLLGQPQVSA